VSLIYQLLYRVGFLPWEHHELPVQLRALVEGDGALAVGRALDLGCGTGAHAVYLAGRGWEVTAIDNVERALRRARHRAAEQRVTVNWVNADVSRLSQLSLAPTFTLVFDRGCYHGLDEHQRDAYASAVTDLAAPGATLLMWAMAPNRRPFEPAGADAAEIAARFAAWQPSGRDQGTAPAPARAGAQGWHRLTRG
jgi:SAM-dependent methyltransferase